MWQALSAPYEVALARWRQAEATLSGDGARAGRTEAASRCSRRPRLAVGLEARPLLRNLRELAGRARIDLPEDVDRCLADRPRGRRWRRRRAGPRSPSCRRGARRNGRSDLVRTIAGEPTPDGPRPTRSG